MTLMEFLFTVIIGALLILNWIRIDQNRRILDALHMLIAQGSQRREWMRKEHSVD